MLLSWLKLYRSTGDEGGEAFPNFELFPCFNIDVHPELVNNNLNYEKESLISSNVCKWQQFKFKKRNLAWVYGIAGCRRLRSMTSTDIRRTINAVTWAVEKKSWLQTFTSPNTVQLNGSFHQYWKTKKCLHVRTCAPNSQSQSRWTKRFSTGIEAMPRISSNQTKSNDLCMNEEK